MNATNEHTPSELMVKNAAGDFLCWRLGLPLLAGGVVLTGLAAIFQPQQMAFLYFVAFLLLWSIALGCLFFVALHHLTHAVWSTVVRRVAEIMVSTLPLVLVLFLPVLVFSGVLFSWLDETVVSGDAVLEGKRAYLNLPFFIIRAAAYFAIWIGFGLYFVRTSLKQDKDEGARPSAMTIKLTHRMRAASAPFMILFAFTVTFAAFDWIMSLEPHWFSTIFGVYIFAGLAVTALAAIILLTLWLRKPGMLVSIDGQNLLVGEKQLHHLGTLLFTFSCFWGYIAVSQYLLIWYANLPEETFWFANRWQGGWKWVSLVLMLLRFVLPFLVLLGRAAKSSPKVLTVIAIAALLGQFVDLYWLVMPEAPDAGTMLTWQIIGPLLLVAGVFFFGVGKFIMQYHVVPVGDPLLNVSKEH